MGQGFLQAAPFCQQYGAMCVPPQVVVREEPPECIHTLVPDWKRVIFAAAAHCPMVINDATEYPVGQGDGDTGGVAV